MNSWDVIVVGAGPAGSSAAIRLARQGLRVTLLDRSASPPPKVCGEYLSPGCVRLLGNLGALQPLRDADARPLSGMLIHTARGQSLRAAYPHDGEAGDPPIHGLAVRRDRLDPTLLDLAITAGADYRPGFQVSDLVWEDDRAVGVRGRHRGGMTTLRGRLIMGADGRNSVVARRLGSVRRHPWLDKVALVGYIAGVTRAADAGEIFLGRDRYCILNPIAPDVTNIGLVINRREFPRATDPARFLLEASGRLTGLGDRLAHVRPVAPVRCLGPLACHATRMIAPGALLIGDAAGFLDPFTGEGIHAALRSAELAVEAALPALLGGLPAPPHLSGYGVAWRYHIRAKWRLCTALQHAIRHPILAECLVSYLHRRPDHVALLMAAIGDLLPASDLHPIRLLTPILSGRILPAALS